MLNCYQEDDCCGDLLADALYDGKLDDADRFECPACGVEWRPQMIKGISFWTLHEIIEVLR